YVVRAMTADGWTLTSPANGGAQNINLASGQNFTGANFGEYHGIVAVPAGATGSISGTFFLDANHDGIWGSGEAASPYWLAYIDANNNGRYDAGEKQVRGDANGKYTFTGLAAGNYVVRSMTASGWTLTSPANGGARL